MSFLVGNTPFIIILLSCGLIWTILLLCLQHLKIMRYTKVLRNLSKEAGISAFAFNMKTQKMDFILPEAKTIIPINEFTKKRMLFPEWIVPEDFSKLNIRWENEFRNMTSDSVFTQVVRAYHGNTIRYYVLSLFLSGTSLSRLCGYMRDITGLKVKEMENRDLFSLLDNLPISLSVKDLDDSSRFILWNRLLSQTTGLDANEVLGECALKDSPWKENLSLIKSLDKHMERDVELCFEIPTLGIDGKNITLRVSKKFLKLPSGRKIVANVFTDITELKKWEEESSARMQYQNKLIEKSNFVKDILERMFFDNNYSNIVNYIISNAAMSVGADVCCVYKFDTETSLAECLYAWSTNDSETPLGKLPIDMMNFPTVRTELEEFRNVIIDNISFAETSYKTFATLRKVRSCIILPLRSKDRKLTGLLCADFVKGAHHFTSDEIGIMTNAARLMDIAYESKIHLEQFNESTLVHKQIFDNTDIPMILMQPDGIIVSANPQAAKVLGMDQKELRGRFCRDVCCIKEGEPERCPLAYTRNNLYPHHIYVENLKGRPYYVTTQPIFGSGGELKFILETGVDISELSKKQKELEDAVMKAKRAESEKTSFLATMSHEIRTPLNAVIGFSELLKNTNSDTSDFKDYITNINVASKALLSLINDILDISKIEADKIVIIPVPVSIFTLFDELKAIFSRSVESKDIYLKFEIQPFLPVLLMDELRLKQILMNLLSNAVKFTSSGGIVVKASYENSKFTVAVTDTGIGINPEFMRQIFEPFTQQDPMRDSRIYKGSGLGLTICKKLAERMDGTIHVDSKMGKGSTFTLELDNVKISERFDFEKKSPLPQTQNMAEKLKSMRILIVDDVPLNVEVIKAMCKQSQIPSMSANSADAALEIMKTNDFDVVFTDIWMPEKSGIDFAREIRSNKKFDGIKIIAITADVDMNADLAGLFDGRVLKPFTLEKLKTLLCTLK